MTKCKMCGGEPEDENMLDWLAEKNVPDPDTSKAMWGKIFHHCSNRAADSYGYRRSRWAIIRDTRAELTAVLATWERWIPDELPVGSRPLCVLNRVHYKLKDDTIVEVEFLFFSMDNERHVLMLKSRGFTGIWHNEIYLTKKQIERYEHGQRIF